MGNVIKLLVIVSVAYWGYHHYAIDKPAQQARAAEKARVQAASSAGTTQASRGVVMYSLTTCPYCDEKRNDLQLAGVKFTKHFLDKDQGAMEQLSQILRENNIQVGGIGTPSFVVNGKVLLNNPSMTEILTALGSG